MTKPKIEWLVAIRAKSIAHAFEGVSTVSVCGKVQDYKGETLGAAQSTDKRCSNCVTRLARLEKVRAKKGGKRAPQ